MNSSISNEDKELHRHTTHTYPGGRARNRFCSALLSRLRVIHLKLFSHEKGLRVPSFSHSSLHANSKSCRSTPCAGASWENYVQVIRGVYCNSSRFLRVDGKRSASKNLLAKWFNCHWLKEISCVFTLYHTWSCFCFAQLYPHWLRLSAWVGYITESDDGNTTECGTPWLHGLKAFPMLACTETRNPRMIQSSFVP